MMHSIISSMVIISFRNLHKQLTLNEVIEELEQDDEAIVSDSITIMPPENCNAKVTDEDSGDEDFVLLQNLPGSQLRAPDEVHHEGSFDDSESDVLSLAQISKRRRTDTGDESVFSGSSVQPAVNATAPTQAEEPEPSTSRSVASALNF